MPFVTARDGAPIHVRIVGRGEPCVLVHGFGMQSLSWLAFIAPLLGRHRFILPDLRGFGPSHDAPLNQRCVLTNYAEDLEDVARALGLSRVPLAGISMGACTALQHLRISGEAHFARYLHIDQALVVRNLDDACHGLFGPEQEAYFERFRRVLEAIEAYESATFHEVPVALRREIWTLFADFAACSFTPRLTQEIVRRVARIEGLMTRVMPMQNWQTYVQIMRAYMEQDYDLREVVSNLSIPMTVLVGGASRMYPPEGQRAIAKLLPSVKVVEIDGVGHFVPFEAPFAFKRALERFLGEA